MKDIRLVYLYMAVFSVIYSCKSTAQSLPIYSKAINEILSNSKIITNKSDLIVSTENIPFSLNDVENDIISKKYYPEFNIFKKSTIEEEKIIGRVRDSLKILNNKLNENFIKNFGKPNYCNLANINYVLFFSKVENGQLFAIILPYSVKLNKTIKFDDLSYGEGYSFLFLLNEKENEIHTTYFSAVHYN